MGKFVGATIFLLFMNLAAVAADAPLASALDGLAKQKFGRESGLAIGDTIDVTDPTFPRERCIAYEEKNLTADTIGAIKTAIDFHFVRNLDQFENTFNITYSAEASSKANFGKVLGGDSSLKTFGQFENFLKQDRESALIILEASAEHGRDLIRNFKLGDSYEKLLVNKNFDEFRKRCGTHFIRGWNRSSSINVYIEISNLSREAKLLLEHTVDAGVGANASLGDAASAEVNAKAKTSISDVLRLANRLGTVKARAEATGGLGIPSVISIVNDGDFSNPKMIPDLLAAIGKSAADFSYANSAPEQFIIVPHPQLNAEIVGFNAVNYSKLGKIYQALVRVDQRMSLYNIYKDRDMNLFNAYFKVNSESVARLRNDLLSLYQSCRDNGHCDGDIPQSIDGILIDDFMANGKLEARCAYSYNHEEDVNGRKVDKYNYISSVSVIWKGNIRFSKMIDHASAEIKRIPPSFELINVSFDPGRQQRISTTEVDGEARGFIELYRETIKPREVLDGAELNLEKLRERRRSLAQTVFVIRYQTLSGTSVEQVLGTPQMTECPIYKQN